MRTVIVRDAMRIPLGKQGENNAVLVVWPEIAEKYAKLYGKGRFELVVVQRGKAYPAVVNVDGADLVWDVRAADVATAEVGSLELIYYVGDTIAKSQTWETLVVASKSADGMTEPPEDPARAWFDEIKRQIGDLNKLTTKDKENLVAAINEAARTGLGGGSVEMRVDGGYIQYSTDGVTWENLIAVADLEGKPGKDGEPGAPGKDGEPGKDGHTPKIAATKTGKITSITADGVEIAQIKDGEDAAADLSLGITGATVGQIAKITAVDETGKPTKWEPADMAGGGEREWVEIGEITTTEDTTEKMVMKFTQDVHGNPLSLKGVLIIGKPLFNDTNNHHCTLICNDSPYGWNANYLLYEQILRNTQTFTVYSEFLRADGINSVAVTAFNSGNVKQNGGCRTTVNTWSPITTGDDVFQFPMRGVSFTIFDTGLLAGSNFKFWGVKA